MNAPNEFEELERHLRGMSLKQPTPKLDRRVAGTLRGYGKATLWLAVAGGMAAGVALALTAMHAWSQTREPRPAVVQDIHKEETPRLVTGGSKDFTAIEPREVTQPPVVLTKEPAHAEPACLQRVWSTKVDRGIVGERGNLPLRCVERQTLRDVILYDPKTERTIRWTTPQSVTLLETTEPY